MKHQSFPVGIVKGYCINVVVDIKAIYLNKRYLSQNKIYYLDKIGQVYYVKPLKSRNPRKFSFPSQTKYSPPINIFAQGVNS